MRRTQDQPSAVAQWCGAESFMNAIQMFGIVRIRGVIGREIVYLALPPFGRFHEVLLDGCMVGSVRKSRTDGVQYFPVPFTHVYSGQIMLWVQHACICVRCREFLQEPPDDGVLHFQLPHVAGVGARIVGIFARQTMLRLQDNLS